MGATAYLEGKLLLTLAGTAFSVPVVYAQLHTGDPGLVGTGNVASTSTRVAVAGWALTQPVETSTDLPSYLSKTGALQWLDLATGETFTHVTLWDASTGGNCLWVVPLDAPIVREAGDDLKLVTLALSLD